MGSVEGGDGIPTEGAPKEGAAAPPQGTEALQTEGEPARVQQGLRGAGGGCHSAKYILERRAWRNKRENGVDAISILLV